MSSLVAIGSIAVGGASNCVGIFNGQNIQNGWDSHAPSISVGGMLMGNFCTSTLLYGALWTTSLTGQALFDQDTKANGSPMLMGP